MSAYEDPMGGYGSSIACKDFHESKEKAEAPTKIKSTIGLCVQQVLLEAIRPTHNREIANNTQLRKKK